MRRVLGVEPRLEGVAGGCDLLLPQRQRLAGGDPQLPFDQVEAGDRLGHRMLDLEPRVHLDEVEAAVLVEQELDRAGILVARRQRRPGRRPAQRRPQLRGQAGRRRLLDDLLVAALQGAVALEQVHRVAVPVGEHLHLDMARAIDQALEEHLVVAERGLGLASAGGQRLEEVAACVDPAHALAAAARRGLDQQREADPPGLGRSRCRSSWSAP